jgi:hypothetical protein
MLQFLKCVFQFDIVDFIIEKDKFHFIIIILLLLYFVLFGIVLLPDYLHAGVQMNIFHNRMYIQQQLQ